MKKLLAVSVTASALCIAAGTWAIKDILKELRDFRIV